MEQAKIRYSHINLTINKIATIVSLSFMATTIIYLFRRGLPDNVANNPLVSNLWALSLGQAIPFIFLMFIVTTFNKSKLVKWLNQICNKNAIYTIGIISLIACLTLTITEVKGIWWTWMSMGIIIATTVLIVARTEKIIMPIESIILACGITSLWRGLWEIPYQFGLKLMYDLPQSQITTETVIQMLSYEVLAEIPLVLGGILIIWYYHDKYKGLITFNKYFVGFFSAYILLTILWFVLGFWVDIYYDWGELKWYYTSSFNKMAMFIYKSSKLAMILSFISLVNKKKNLIRKEQ